LFVAFLLARGIAVTAGLIVCLGFGLSYYIDPSWVGAVVAWSLIVLLTSITPVIEYFHTFEYSLNMAVQTFISGVSFYVGLGLIFVKVLDSESGHGAFMLLLVGFLYPILLALIIGTAKWRDDQWVISDHVVWTLFVAGVLLFLLFFAIALVYTPWWIGQ
jgi:hypothetical protein